MVDIGSMMLHDWLISITPWTWLRSIEYSFAHLTFLEALLLIGFGILIFEIVVLCNIDANNEEPLEVGQ